MDLMGDEQHSSLVHVLKMSVPASITMLNTTAMKFIDGLMVARVGHRELGAQFMAGMWSFVPESFFLGVLLVVNTYVGQNYGAGHYRRTSRYVWAGMLLSVLAAALMAPTALLARPLFGMFVQDPGASAHLIQLEVIYYRYMILTIGLTLCSRVLEQFFYGVHRAGVVMVASCISFAFNIVANYALIFGEFGFPALGLEGAAIGTVVSWGLQFTILITVFLSRAFHRRFATRFVTTARRRHCADLLKLGWPAGLQLCNDILCWTLFISLLVSRFFGDVHLAASTIAMRYLGISFMPAVGIGIATTAIVGKCIGQERPDLARRRTHVALLVAMAYMGLCGVAFWLFRYPLVRWFIRVGGSTGLPPAEMQRLATDILDVGVKIMLCAALFQLIDAVGIVYTGALRGTGDTLWPMAVTIALSWSITVGGGLAMASAFPQLTSVGPWIAASVYVVALGLVMAWRFESGAWRKIDLLGRRRKRFGPTPALPGADVAGTIPPRMPNVETVDLDGNGD